MTNEKVELLCNILHVSPETVVAHDDNWYYVGQQVYYVGSQDLNHSEYAFIAQIGLHKVYEHRKNG